MNEMTSLPDHGRPRTDNLPDDVAALPVMPLELSEEMASAKYAEEQAGKAAEADDLPFDPEKVYGLKLRVRAFADAAGAWKDIRAIRTKEQAERLTDFQRGATALAKQVEEARKADKKIHDERAAAVQVAYKPLGDVLEKIASLMKVMMADWLRAEQARIDAEKAEAKRQADQKAAEAEAERKRAEAANDVVGMIEAEAKRVEAERETKAAEKPAKARADSASGGWRAMSLRTQAYANITSQNAVYMYFREHPRVAEVLQSLADAAIRAGETIPGAERAERQVAA